MTTVAPIHRCSHCSREFGRAEHLVRHERTHTKEKPYGCDLCTQAFSRRDLLRRHEWKAHQRGRPPKGNERATRRAGDGMQRQDMTSPEDESPSSHSQIQPPINLPDQQWLSHHPQDSSSSLLGTNVSIQDSFMPDEVQWLQTLDELGPNALDQFNFAASPSRDWGPGVQFGPSVGTVQLSRQSLFSLPPSPELQPLDDASSGNSLTGAELAITEACWLHLQQEAQRLKPGYVLVGRDVLCSYIDRYFDSFNRHQPLFHQPTWTPSEAPAFLIFGVCANGALYSLEGSTARDLFEFATALMPTSGGGLPKLQGMMLLTAFAAWGGEPDDLDKALQYYGPMTILLRREWARMQGIGLSADPCWKEWLQLETLKRVTGCIFTLMTLLNVAYDVPSPFLYEKEHELPSKEDKWDSKSEEEWIQACQRSTDCTESQTMGSITDQLADESSSAPPNIGTFACHLVISFLLQKIILSHRAQIPNGTEELSTRDEFANLLSRWQQIFKHISSLGSPPDDPREPMLFNSTAISRIAYIRLASDFSHVRRSFGVCSEEQVVELIRSTRPPSRGSTTTRAALQACLALRTPTQLGFQVVARTSFWFWSVQHSLSYFECALFLSKWAQSVSCIQGLSLDEQKVLRLLKQLTRASGEHARGETSRPLSALVLLRWAELLDTGTTTVWGIMPRMARILTLYADTLA
ncbi:hypothetical protein NCS55_01407600 [Fusarium keratoplasticum]|nr:hypothetical protein NCS55_01407600 [Fusarium keratoplasticum]